MAARLDATIQKHGQGGIAGHREGQAHLMLSKSGLSNFFNHYLTHGAEFDQQMAQVLLGPDGKEFLAHDRKPTVIQVAVPGHLALDAAHPSFSIDDLRDRGDVPNLIHEFLEAWSFRLAYPEFQSRTLEIDCGLVFRSTVPAAWIIDFDNPALSAANNRIEVNQGYDYDAVGNLTYTPNRLGQSKGYKYEFDAENHQVSFDREPVVTPTIKDAIYVYDGGGQRVKKIADGITTIFVYDVSGQLVAEYDTAGYTGAGTSYLTSDTLGTPRIITGSNLNDGYGGVNARHDYLPFGEEVFVGRNNSYVADNLKQKFTQKERDLESGLDYFGARYYGSAQGRFTSPDPLLNSGRPDISQSWNRYAYTLNNPLKYTDPNGLYEWGATLGGRASDDKVSEEVRKRRELFRATLDNRAL